MDNTAKVKETKVLTFAPVAHTVIVRPRFQEWRDMYVIRVINELGKCLQTFEYSDSLHAENEYQKMLKANKNL